MGQGAPARHAATVALLRDGAGGLEVFLLRRPRTMAFAPGAYVFPGGAVEESDLAAPVVDGADLDLLGRRAGTPAPRALLAAAVRETYEECGVLLAADPLGRTAASPRPEDRAELVASRLDLAALLTRHGLALDPALLPVLAHWITPARERRRFDTRFFLAALPDGQTPQADGDEADGSGWWRPDDLIEEHERGEKSLMLPTFSVLAWLARCRDTLDALGRARELAIRPMLPTFEIEEGTGALGRWRFFDAPTGKPLDPRADPILSIASARGAFNPVSLQS